MIVDAPKTEAKNLVPTVVARTSETAYVRFHGRNASTWNKRTGSAAERFDYLYSEEELEEWVEPLRELASESDIGLRDVQQQRPLARCRRPGSRVWTRTRSPATRSKGEVAQAPANALMLRRALEAAGVPVA